MTIRTSVICDGCGNPINTVADPWWEVEITFHTGTGRQPQKAHVCRRCNPPVGDLVR